MKSPIRILAVLSLAALVGSSPAARLPSTSVAPQYRLVPLPASSIHRQLSFDPHIRNTNGTSTNWSGYVAEKNLASPPANSVSDVKGTWTVPTVLPSTSSNTYSSFWVGIDGYSNSTVEQIGTEHDSTPTGTVYYAWFEMYPKIGYRILNFPVVPGDTITAEVKFTGNGNFQLTIDNVSRKAHFATTEKMPQAKRQSAEWIAEAPWSGGVLPLANFGTAKFSGASATINGKPGTISDAAWQNDSITMQDKTGLISKATPGELSSDGSAFDLSWAHE